MRITSLARAAAALARTVRIAGLRHAFVAIASAAPALAGAAVTVEVVDASGAALEDAVVYVVPANHRIPAHGALTGAIDQVGRQFSPRVTVVQTGTSVVFPNHDNIRHQVYSFSLPKVFELKLYSGQTAQPVVFDKPGLVVMGCNIHDQMVGFVQVVDTPWFGKSGRDGLVRIDDVPGEDMVVHVWHWRGGDAEVARPLKATGEARIKVAVDVKS